MTQCDVCKQPVVTGLLWWNHKNICEYMHFKTQVAPQSDLGCLSSSDLDLRYQGRAGRVAMSDGLIPTLSDVNQMLMSLGYSVKSFDMSGIAGRYQEVFVSNAVIAAVRLYYSREAFAGMTLAEFVVSMVPLND